MTKFEEKSFSVLPFIELIWFSGAFEVEVICQVNSITKVSSDITQAKLNIYSSEEEEKFSPRSVLLFYSQNKFNHVI